MLIKMHLCQPLLGKIPQNFLQLIKTTTAHPRFRECAVVEHTNMRNTITSVLFGTDEGFLLRFGW